MLQVKLSLIFLLGLSSCQTSSNNKDANGSRLDETNVVQDKVALSQLPWELRRDPIRSKIAVSFGIQNPQIYDLGVYGKKGNLTVYVAPKKDVKDFDRLYWTMVKVLSEKYGCMIRRKTDEDRSLHFECRDGRTISMRRKIGATYAMFVGRQFDSEGNEIIIPRKASKNVSQIAQN